MTELTTPTTSRKGVTIQWRALAITFAAIVLALIAGAILMIVSDPDVISLFAYLFTAPALPLGAAWEKVSSAYSALFLGAVGSPAALAATTREAAPLISAGLGVGLGFRAGLFNIGAQGQAIMGAILAAWVGFALQLPPVLHLIVALLAGVLGGALWGGIVGWLKAKTGAHEVIVTIMFNYIAVGTLAWLLTTTAFRRPGRQDPIAPEIHSTAAFPGIFGQLHVGFLVALLAAFGTWWLIDRSTIGFQIRAVGANPHAAGTAGMDVARMTIITMTISRASWRASPASRRRSDPGRTASRRPCRRVWSARSASTPSPWPSSAARARWASSSPGSCSAVSTQAASRCRASPARR